VYEDYLPLEIETGIHAADYTIGYNVSWIEARWRPGCSAPG
jgi:hypothetical protein